MKKKKGKVRNRTLPFVIERVIPSINPDYSPRNFVVTKANLKMCMKRTWVH